MTLAIERVLAPEAASPGETAEISVRVRHRGSGDGFDRGVVMAHAPALTPPDVIYQCFLLAPGDRATIRGCSIEECADGAWVMPDRRVEFEVLLGAIPADAHCANDAAIEPIETRTVGVEAALPA